MKGLIVANGQINDLKLLKKIADSVDYIICADGGANHVIKEKIKPNLILGDLDSIDEKTLKIFKKEEIEFAKFPEKKDFTDTELAIQFLIDKGVDEIIFMGVIGTRFDHTMANILLLYKLLKRGIVGQVIDEKNTIYITDDILELRKENNTFVSVIPITNEGAKVTLKGFEYETNKERFAFASTYGISNEIIEEKGIIKVEEGICIVIKSRD